MTKSAKPFQAIILAAGESSRFWPFSEAGHKSLFKLGGKAIIWHTISGLIDVGVKELIIIHAPGEQAKFESALSGIKAKITYLVQPKPLGTGDAIKLAAKQIKSAFFVFNAAHTDSKMLASALLKKKGADFNLLTTTTSSPSAYAAVSFYNGDGKQIIKITEKPKTGEGTSGVRTIGAYLLPHSFLSYLDKADGEYSLIEALNMFVKDNYCGEIRIKTEPASVKYAFGVLDLIVETTNTLNRKVSRQTKIAKSATITGKVVIGADTEIKENVVIYGPVYIGENCFIGANSVIRPNSVLENGVSVGVNSEIKRSYLGENTHMHSGYIGDSVIGENCRIGGGFVTANRRIDRKNIKFTVRGEAVDSGKTHLGAVVGSGTKIGIRASAMPGTIIGSNCIIGSNTEVKGVVESGSLVYVEQKITTKKINE